MSSDGSGLRPRIVLGLYSGRSSVSDAQLDGIQMAVQMEREGIFCDVMQRVSSRVDQNRNYLIATFLERYPEATHLFIRDDDMRYPPVMPGILAQRDKPIISGLYFRRDWHGNHCPVLYRHAGRGVDDRPGQGGAENDRFEPISVAVYDFLQAGGLLPEHNLPFVYYKNQFQELLAEEHALVRIDASGFGCLLIRRDAAEAMGRYCKEHHVPFLGDEPGLNGDFAFGRNAMRAGIEYWADLSVVASHQDDSRWIGLQTFNEYCWTVDKHMKTAYPERYERVAVSH